MRILTFNHHESYIAALAPLEIPFDVVIKKGSLDLSWSPTARTVPQHFKCIDFSEALVKLSQKKYDLILCHTIKNLLWLLFRPHKAKTIFIAHIPLYWLGPIHSIKSAMKLLIFKLYQWLHPTIFVAVSPWKASTWGFSIPQTPIVPFYPIPFPEPFVSKQSHKPKSETPIAVTVGNLIKERGQELGWPLLDQVLKLEDVRIIGNNPHIPNNIKPQSFAHFIELFSESSIYVYPVEQPFGDGYNTAMLEAMLLGMPIVTIKNASSPILDGINGLVATDSQGIAHCIKLLKSDADLRKRLGLAAKKTVQEKFNKTQFLESWSFSINKATQLGFNPSKQDLQTKQKTEKQLAKASSTQQAKETKT